MKNLENLFLMEYSSTGSGSLTDESEKEINRIIDKINSNYNLEKGLYVIIPNEEAPKQIADIVNEKTKHSRTLSENLLWPRDDKINKKDLIKIHKKIEEYDNVLITAHSMVLGRIRAYFLKDICHIKKTNSYELNQKAKTKCININLKEKNYYIVD